MSPRPLPDLIILGAMKAGTTSLYDHLARHPQVGVSAQKETDFFLAGTFAARGLSWYQQQFSPGFERYAEASPNYTKAPLRTGDPAFDGVPARIAATLPQCKFVFLARDPVARAQSQYRHALAAGADVPALADLPGSHTLKHLIETSAYGAQIEAYLAHFPPERFLFLCFEDFIADPGPALSRLADFLGIEDIWPGAGAAGAANTGDGLAQMSPLVFALRRSVLGGALKAILPRPVIDRLKGWLPGRRAPAAPAVFPPALAAHIRRELAEDTAQFCALSGISPSRWPG